MPYWPSDFDAKSKACVDQIQVSSIIHEGSDISDMYVAQIAIGDFVLARGYLKAEEEESYWDLMEKVHVLAEDWRAGRTG